ncbi:TPR-like protein [Zopfia rhizophila CBS 207.26]|uniref:TPR-like protein n=1 Tax=Zopfia rhizophila CBS 207.26 TaxID=1314779 RepID=A0A6A6DA38_9PEZI|nr:TPR-like protein [Zopfia rhizophila CBS 207.26]
MDPRGGFFNAWPDQQPFNNGQFYPGPFQNGQYISPYLPLQQPHTPFTSGGYEDPSNGGFITSGPVVHEGFIPAIGHDEDEEVEPAYPVLPADYRESLFQRHALESENEDNSSDEERERVEEEQMLREIADKNDLEEDSDFSMADVDEEDDVDDLMVEDDFDEEEPKRPRSSSKGTRGMGRRRGRPRGSGRGRGAEGTRTARKGPRKGRTRVVADPGPQFKDLQRLANEAYIAKDFQTAIEYANKAIQLNPEIFATHSLLSEVYLEQGEEQKSLEALIVGAPTKRDKRLWFHIIDLVSDLDGEKYPMFTKENKTAITLDCLKSIIRLDPKDYEARTQKLEIDSELGLISKSVSQCRKLLGIRPHDGVVLKRMAKLGTSTPKQTQLHLRKMIHAFDKSIACFLRDDEPSSSNFDWSVLNVYLELLERSGDYDHALAQLKSLSRWLQGRKDEKFWDSQMDDREFDREDEPRRITVPEFSPSGSSRGAYGLTLPLEIRVKMGVFRLRKNPSDFSEAMHHFEMLEPENPSPDAKVMDYGDLFRDIADALHTAGYHEEALRFYEPLYEKNPEEMTVRSYLRLHSCYEDLGYPEKAKELIQPLLEWETEDIEELAPLAKFFEDQKMDEEAWRRGDLCYRKRGGKLLSDLGFKALVDIQVVFWKEKRQARGPRPSKQHGKERYRQYMDGLRGLRMAPPSQSRNESQPSLGPLLGRPMPGLFRTKKQTAGREPKRFDLLDMQTIEGTTVPLDAIEQKILQRKLDQLASDYPEELTAARQQHRDIEASFRLLNDLSDKAENGDIDATNTWMSTARELIEEFSNFELFYCDRADRHEQFRGYFRRIRGGDLWKDGAMMVLAVTANKVEDGQEVPQVKETKAIPDEFYGIHFDRWLDIAAQYAIFLARRCDDLCFDVIDKISLANIFHHSKAYVHRLHICRLACAIVLEDSDQVSIACRWLMRTYPFGSNPFRLFSSANRLCPIQTGYNTGATQKAFMRYIKTMDYAVLTPEQREMYSFNENERFRWMNKAIQEGILDFVKGHDPVIFTAYAHMHMHGGNYIAALNYYFRAFTITPEDTVLNLSIGLAYIQHAMKRQSENRQYQIQQGLAFVFRYHELRTKDNVALHCSEAEFNVGRVWHMLGLTYLAMPAYEKCIALSKRVKEEAKDLENHSVEDFATEAAFAVQTISALSGDFQGAKNVTEEALVIE